MQPLIQEALYTLSLRALSEGAGHSALTALTQDPHLLPWGWSSTRAQTWPQTQPCGGRGPVSCSSDDHWTIGRSCLQPGPARTRGTAPCLQGCCHAGLGSPQQPFPSQGSPTLPIPQHCLGEGTEICLSCKLRDITICLFERNLFSVCKVIF